MRRVLLIAEVPATDETSRGADFALRADAMKEEGWETVMTVVPSPYLLTFLPQVFAALITAYREDVDLVTSVSNPFHLQLIGFLVSVLTRRPWVAEIRDPMVENPDKDPRAISTRLAKVVEWIVVQFADFVVWADGIQMEEDYFETTYDVPPAKIRKLPFKGFLPSRFDAVDPVEYDEFTVTYAGRFYDDWIEPYTFLEGLEVYVREYDRDLTVQFYGDWRAEYDAAVARAGIEDVVSHHEFVPKSEIIPVLKGSDALLYIGGSNPANELNVPSKFYDYIGAKRPILAVVDPSFRVAELIASEDLGVIAPYDDPEAIAHAIHKLRDNGFYGPAPALYERFDRHRKIEALMQAYEDAVRGRRPPKPDRQLAT